jgi:hypothetical protein
MKYALRLTDSRKYSFVNNTISLNWKHGLYPNLDWDNASEFSQEIQDDLRDHPLWETTPIHFKWEIQNVQDNLFKIVLTNTTENLKFYDFLIDITPLLKSPAQTAWGIDQDFIESLLPTNSTTIPSDKIYNAYSLSYGNGVNNIFGGKSLFNFFVTSDNPTSDDIILVIQKPMAISDTRDYYPPKTVRPGGDNIVDRTGFADHTIEVDTSLSLLKEFISPPEELMAQINTTSSISGDVITVNVTTDERIDFLYLQTNTGFLPKTKIPLTNGTGSFKVITTGLDSGDTVSVKIGFKFWLAQTTFTKTI